MLFDRQTMCVGVWQKEVLYFNLHLIRALAFLQTAELMAEHSM